jgi:hypothetical protein
MEPSREQAKGAIVSRDSQDAELDQAFEEASKFRLDLVKENNRHTESMRGAVGRMFGHDNNTPVYVAATGMILGLIGYGALVVVATKNPGEANMWMQQAERLLAFSASCLAFIFGQGLSKD